MRFAMIVLALILVGLSLSGCRREAREPQQPTDLISMLQSPVWQERRAAAIQLRDDDGPPPEVFPHLYAAIQTEQNPYAYDALLVTLGASGAAEAKPLIDARINDPDEDVRKSAQAALKLWLVRNSLMSEDEELPPPPHPFYGPVQVPPGAPASRPMLPTPPVADAPSAPPGADAPPPPPEDPGPTNEDPSAWPLPTAPPAPAGDSI